MYDRHLVLDCPERNWPLVESRQEITLSMSNLILKSIHIFNIEV